MYIWRQGEKGIVREEGGEKEEGGMKRPGDEQLHNVRPRSVLATQTSAIGCLQVSFHQYTYTPTHTQRHKVYIETHDDLQACSSSVVLTSRQQGYMHIQPLSFGRSISLALQVVLLLLLKRFSQRPVEVSVLATSHILSERRRKKIPQESATQRTERE